jgi:hypothetical protein
VFKSRRTHHKISDYDRLLTSHGFSVDLNIGLQYSVIGLQLAVSESASVFGLCLRFHCRLPGQFGLISRE